LVERINFAAGCLGRTDLPGVRGMIDRIATRGKQSSPQTFVNECIDMVGSLNVTDATREALVAHAQEGGDVSPGTAKDRAEFTRRCGEMFQMIAATSEFQFC